MQSWYPRDLAIFDKEIVRSRRNGPLAAELVNRKPGKTRLYRAPKKISAFARTRRTGKHATISEGVDEDIAIAIRQLRELFNEVDGGMEVTADEIHQSKKPFWPGDAKQFPRADDIRTDSYEIVRLCRSVCGLLDFTRARRLVIALHPAKGFDREGSFVSVDQPGMGRAQPNGIVDMRALFGRHGFDKSLAAGRSCAYMRSFSNIRHSSRGFIAWPHRRPPAERATMTGA